MREVLILAVGVGWDKLALGECRPTNWVVSTIDRFTRHHVGMVGLETRCAGAPASLSHPSHPRLGEESQPVL